MAPALTRVYPAYLGPFDAIEFGDFLLEKDPFELPDLADFLFRQFHERMAFTLSVCAVVYLLKFVLLVGGPMQMRGRAAALMSFTATMCRLVKRRWRWAMPRLANDPGYQLHPFPVPNDAVSFAIFGKGPREAIIPVIADRVLQKAARRSFRCPTG